jgi:hypothetical protein
MNLLIRQMNLELFLIVVAVTLSIGILAATLISPVTIFMPVMAQNMTVLNMTAGEMIAGNTSDVVTVTG